jgi:hypothetical protein
MKKTILVVAGLGVACVLAGVLIMKRPPGKEGPSPIAKTASQLEPPPVVEKALPAAPPEEAPPAVAETAAAPAPSVGPEAPPPVTPQSTEKKAPKAAARAGQGGGGAKEPLKDPLAREALALVGMDPTAEAYWSVAINDPDLSPHERQDLIEDLNEEGLSDPKHPAPEDLPVILSRIQLIEAHGPYAMDQANADAFQEAYKDLVNLANSALGGGEPVR